MSNVLNCVLHAIAALMVKRRLWSVTAIYWTAEDGNAGGDT
jgi:hypothetical protein